MQESALEHATEAQRARKASERRYFLIELEA